MTLQLNNEQARVAVIKIAPPDSNPVLAIEVALNGAALTIAGGSVASDQCLNELALALIHYVTEHYPNGE